MARYRFLIADVFSASPFGGNQLAVLPDAAGISDEGMQRVAREFNFPESTFVLPATDPGSIRKVRIFTPARELPFAGHPTVGTACLLVREGLAREGKFVLQEGIGPVSVEVSRRGDGLFSRLTVDQAPQLHAGHVAVADAAAAIGLDTAEVERLFAATLGIDFTFIRLRDARAVDRAVFDHAAWRAAFSGRIDGQLYVFAGALADGGTVHARLFAPSFGIAEDPATGSAATVLAGAGAMLARHQKEQFRLTIDQGVLLGRPSRLEASATLAEGKVVAVSVGGATTFVAEGEIEVPEPYLLG
ncbi:MAG TPA: PhzF family phenazine biosynthesis protein [Sphingomicrobium sp.]|nr:PhzF family phenazine biosynthesis protein [Sphingomicrobium sp.]